jgi:hypothetical protein
MSGRKRELIVVSMVALAGTGASRGLRVRVRGAFGHGHVMRDVRRQQASGVFHAV